MARMHADQNQILASSAFIGDIRGFWIQRDESANFSRCCRYNGRQRRLRL